MSATNKIRILVVAGCIVCIYFIFFYSGRINNSLPILQEQIRNFSLFEAEFSSLNDPVILDYIRTKKLDPPSPQPYNISARLEDLNKLVSFVKKKRSGFFIECGANDGQFRSESLTLEKEFGWTGLLLEASPTYYQRLLLTHRKAWSANICLSGKVEQLEFMIKTDVRVNWEVGVGKINSRGKYEKPVGNAQFEQLTIEAMVDCFPLASVLAALKVNTVNYFILDVEGHEYHVLSAIPFSKLNIEVLKVEFNLAPEGKDAITDLMQRNDYDLLGQDPYNLYFLKKGVTID